MFPIRIKRLQRQHDGVKRRHGGPASGDLAAGVRRPTARAAAVVSASVRFTVCHCEDAATYLPRRGVGRGLARVFVRECLPVFY